LLFAGLSISQADQHENFDDLAKKKGRERDKGYRKAKSWQAAG